MKAIDPFISSLTEDQKREIKGKLAIKLFTETHQEKENCEAPTIQLPSNFVKDVAEIVNKE